MTRSWLWSAALLLAPALASAQSAPSAQGAPSAQSGPKFTAEQATTGKEIFGKNCSPCHNVDLSGGPIAPPLTGGFFGPNWNGRPVSQLFQFVSTEMPQTAPGSLDRDSYLRVISYILQFNGLAAGSTPLAPDAPDVIDIPTK